MGVKLDILGNIAVLTLNNPPVNAISQQVRYELLTHINHINESPKIHGVILTGNSKFFSAGADIKEFGKPLAPPSLPDVIDALENCQVPTLAVINGVAYGGGLELALGCRFRLGHATAKCAVPEVKLGLIPGAGGTQRLPRLIGALQAGEMISSGKPISAKQALEVGLFDALIDDDLLSDSKNWLLAKIDKGQIPKPLAKRKILAWDETDFAKLVAKTKARARGQLSPVKALEAVKAAHELGFDQGIKRERQIFEELMKSEQRAGLIHAFFGERQVSKRPELQDVAAIDISRINIVGAGTMGVGIALAALAGGFEVGLFDIDQDGLARAVQKIGKTITANCTKGRISEAQKQAQIANLASLASLADVAKADLVIEAALENMDVKKQIFTQLDKLAAPEVILASNTSYLDINDIAKVTKRPDRVLGLHFFSPANIMKLLEVVRADKTSKQTLATALAVGKKLGKVAVISGVCDGFIGNRMLGHYRRQADYIIEDGAMPWDVDRVMREFGFAMGPFEVSDLAGIDIGWHNRRRLDETRPKAERYSNIADRLYEMGRLGQKTGAGYYKYEQGVRRGQPDSLVVELIEKERANKGIKPRHFSDEEIRDRLVLALVNEGAKILEDGIVARALDIDMVWLFGYGFPRYRGGPMFWADSRGLDLIKTRIEEFAAHDSYSWQISPLIKNLADAGKGFADL